MNRRIFLKAVALSISSIGLLKPGVVLGQYPVAAFKAKEASESLREAFGTSDIAASEQIQIDLPLVARNAHMLPVRVRTSLAKVESIALVVSSNEEPFTALFKIYDSVGFVSTRVRVADNGEVLAVVKADGVLYTKTQSFRVGNFCAA